jgi:hypothetical protein
MRAFKTRWFGRWARREGLPERTMVAAVLEIERGLIDAELGGGLIKKRVALPGRGKRGGARTLLAYRRHDVAFFVYGFAKNDRPDINPRELSALQRMARELLSYDELRLGHLVATGELIEVVVDDQ